MDRQETVLRIVALREKGQELKPVERPLGLGQVGRQTVQRRRVVFLGGQFREYLRVVERLLDGGGRFDDLLQALQVLDGSLGGFLVVPEPGGRQLLLNAGEVLPLAGDVKESPGAPEDAR